MTDRFEEAVRSAARDLGDPGPAPSYHGAWHRGRRRRASKQAALVFAGAALLVALMTVGYPGLDGSRPEGDDLAIDLQAGAPGAEAPAPAAGAAGSTPLASPPPEPATDAAGIVAVDATDEEAGASASATPRQAPESAPPATTQPVVPLPQTTRPASEQDSATAVSPTPAASATRTPSPSPNQDGRTAVPTPNGQSTPPIASTAPGVTGTPTNPNQTPAAVAAAPLQSTRPAAAVLIGPLATLAGARCDTNGDGVGDATCEIQLPYACDGDNDTRAGYVAVDLNGDGQIDTCTPTSTAFCDTTGDGFGDTPCVIKPDPARG